MRKFLEFSDPGDEGTHFVAVSWVQWVRGPLGLYEKGTGAVIGMSGYELRVKETVEEVMELLNAE